MRIANVSGRLTLLADDSRGIDVAEASDGRFDADPQAIYDRWDEFTEWAATAGTATASTGATAEFDRAALGSPAPAPRQVLAIGLNYRSHAAESGFASPDEQPVVFTKFASCITGPHGDITLPPGGHTDWEVELVAVIGRPGRHVSVADGWSHVAGLAVGQDISERISQLAGPAPQFSMGKSFPGFGPIGPWLVTPDEFANPDDLELGCAINGEEVQKGRTQDLIFSIPLLVASLSRTVTLLPGDVIFTGTPAGVGMGRDPQRWLSAGDELVTWIEGIGEMRHRFVAPG
jgi:2-keto-4-pentenoate hydratase/2-oxohepta-3-ene-1,7-dioic acid hydratase in catechol pathway